MIQFNQQIYRGKLAIQQPRAAQMSASPLPPGSALFSASQDSVHFGSHYSQNRRGVSGLQSIINNSLVSAAGQGNVSEVNSLLIRNQVDVNHVNFHTRKTALMEAAENDKVDVLKLLIRKNANLEKCDLNNRTALMLAARTGAIKSMELLIKHGANIQKEDHSGMNALLVAVNCRRKEAAEFLLDQKLSIESKDFIGRTPLQLAAERGHTDMVKMLIARGADLNASNFEGMTPLILAARDGRSGAVKALIEAGADINARNRFGMTALMLAARDGNQDVVRQLLEQKADVNVVSNDRNTALFMAVGNDNPAILKMLIAHGADVGAVCEQGSTPLMKASRLGYVEDANALLTHPNLVNINHADAFGNTALSYAADQARVSITKALLDAPDIDIDVRNGAGDTPLILAAKRGVNPVKQGAVVQTAAALLEAKADVNKTNARNATALHFACTQGQFGLAKLLISHGAHLNVIDRDGATPILLATQAGHGKVVNLLLKAEGTPQRPHTPQYQQFQNYVSRVMHAAGLDRQKAFLELLPTLAKHDLFRIAEPLYMAQGKPLEGLAWQAEYEMNSIIDSSKAVKDLQAPALLDAHQQHRDQAWRNIEFLARHDVDMEKPLVAMAIAMQDKAAAEKKIIEQIKAEKAERAQTLCQRLAEAMADTHIRRRSDAVE